MPSKGAKRDYVCVKRLPDAEMVLRELPRWFEDYNEVRPHSRLGMMSSLAYRRLRQEAA